MAEGVFLFSGTTIFSIGYGLLYGTPRGIAVFGFLLMMIAVFGEWDNENE